MNERGVEVLVGAAMRSVRQIRALADNEGGRCARGVLCEAELGTPQWNDARYYENKMRVVAAYDLRPEVTCPECGHEENEFGILSHFNDAHGWDFLTIARKLGDASASEPEDRRSDAIKD